MDDDFGTKFRALKVRLGTTLSIPAFLGLFGWLAAVGRLDEFPLWLLGVCSIWLVYATWQSMRYYRNGYTSYRRADDQT